MSLSPQGRGLDLAEEESIAITPKRSKSQVKGKPLVSIVESALFARERRTKRKEEQKVSIEAPHVSPVIDLSDRVIEFAISSANALALNVVVDAAVSEASVPIDLDNPFSTPLASNPIA